MTDARLLATNPENSSLVPVACNAQGQLLVNEVVIEGIDNDVTVNGDLDVTGYIHASGAAEFAGGQVQIDGNGRYLANSPTQPMDLSTQKTIADAYSVLTLRSNTSTAGSGTAVVDMKSDGSAEFAGNVQVGGVPGTANGARLRSTGLIECSREYFKNVFEGKTTGNSESTSSISASGAASFAGQIDINGAGGFAGYGWAIANNGGIGNKTPSGTTFNVDNTGAATFAGGKAGFTADGHLWCTTRRGDTVILDATSNGLASWVDYTPPLTRRDLIKEKLDALEEGRGDVSSQELDET